MQTLHRPPAPPVAPIASTGTAWLLDVERFHAEFEQLFASLGSTEGPVPLRQRATELWSTDDPERRSFVELVETDTPDEWAAAFDERHLGQWYRLLMAAHVEPTRAVRAPEVVRTRLPALGFSPAYARRLALGREMTELASTRGTPAVAAAMELVLGPGHRGWLSHDDIAFALERLQQVDRRAFRRAQDLVPVCEDLWDTLSEASTDESTVLLVLAPRR